MAASSSLRSGPGSTSHGGGIRPPNADVLYEILLRVPAKDLCRCRAVCRSWCCLLSDPHFIAVHAARHDPLIVAGHSTHNQSTLCDIMDFAGRVVKQVHGTGNWWPTAIHLEFICISNGRTFRLHNLSTGAVYNLPEELAEEHAAEERNTYCFYAEAAFGQARSTGQYKVLRVLKRFSNHHIVQFFEIITLGGGNHARWRAKEAPPYSVYLGMWATVVLEGIAYYFCDEPVVQEEGSRIASFDLETEKWRPTQRGPLRSRMDYAPGQHFHPCETADCSMSTIDGRLVVVHRTYPAPLVNLWFLMDSEKGLWVKKHSIQVQSSDPDMFLCAEPIRPLLVLSDGRILLVQVGDESGLLRIYDPRTNTYSDVAEIMGRCSAVGLYTRGALSLANGTS